ncbi:MAG: glycosyltransferase [Dehalococcoidia bacterium]
MDAPRYESQIDLTNENNSQTLVILLTGENKRVLETGPATGYVTRELQARSCKVTGLEIDEQAAAIAEPFCERMIVGDLEKLDFAETFKGELFDVAIFGDVLEHLADPWRVLREIRPFLAPGGYIVASVPNVAHASLRLSVLQGDFKYTELGLLDRTHLRFFTRESLGELFRDTGYSIIEWRRVVLDPFATEQGLRESDYPPYLAQAMRNDEEALTYQYVVTAVVSDTPIAFNGHDEAAVPRTAPLSSAMAAIRAEENRILALERRMATITEGWHSLTPRLEEAEAKLLKMTQHAGNLGNDLSRMRNSIGWRLLQIARTPIRVLAPSGSPQRLPLIAVRRAIGLAARRGPMALVKKVANVRQWPAVMRNLRRPQVPHMDLNAAYQIWLERYSITPERADRLRIEALTLTYRPRISIVTPVYNPEVSWLRDAIDSVAGQVYDNWELCLADDGSTKPGIRELLEDYGSRDNRIKVSFAEQNAGISAASNRALAMATGEYVGLLDHDDVLTPDALYVVAKQLNERPEIDYIYSDEDKMELDGGRLDPFFKPDWSPDTLYCLNYATHFSVYRKSVLDGVGGFRLGFEGSQDWDLTLRVTELTDRVAHIARPLYSWRKVPGSAAAADDAKEYAHVAARKAIGEALERRGTPGQVLDGPYKGYYRVKYDIIGEPKVAIVIPTRDGLDMLRKCIDSIRTKSSYTNYEIIIINNQSSDPATLKYFDQFGGRVIDYPHPFNYSAQMNLGVREAGAEYVLLLNNDTIVMNDDWIEAMLEYGQRADVGAVGARLLFPDGRVQHEGVYVGCGGGLAGHIDHKGYYALGECVLNVSAVTAACMLVKASVYQEVGGLDEELNVAYNDVDFCLRLRAAGYEVIYTPHARLVHREGGTRGHRHPDGNESLFRSRWPNYRDPYYNPNFDVDHPFALKL